ncbi:uncharacterized protein LOC141683270 [Apium graveolens]|uniref:uncharacterized protein LOC141683270 n=1 Tax=Apium graveolens TaxID=4045 RepID=UPI003D78FC2A
MGGPQVTVPGRTILQQTFNDTVRENIEDLGMDPTEALQDAIETLTLQGVDLSGIVTCVPGESNPVIECLNKLKQFEIDSSCDNSKIKSDFDLEEVIGVLNELTELCGVEGSGNAAIATRYGGLESVCLICSRVPRVPSGCGRGLVSCFNALAYLLHDLQCTEIFRNSNGPEVVMRILNDGTDNVTMLSSGFSVIAAAATGNEVLKELFMDLKVDELMITVLKEQKNEPISSLYDAIRVLLSADDNRVVASQLYARRFAKIGIAEALVHSLRDRIRSPSLVSASIALKAVAVNDEICRSVAESGGIDAILCCINDSGAQRNQIVAQTLCSLLNKLAGSDANKTTIVAKGGMDKLITLSTRFSDDPFVLQEVMSIICTLSLRAPDNATRAIEAGAGDLAIRVMNKFPEVPQLQKHACLMIRNHVVRNPENRQVTSYVISHFFVLVQVLALVLVLYSTFSSPQRTLYLSIWFGC